VLYDNRPVGGVYVFAADADRAPESGLKRVDGNSVDACLGDFHGDHVDLLVYHFREANKKVNADQKVSQNREDTSSPRFELFLAIERKSNCFTVHVPVCEVVHEGLTSFFHK
jgi:hypothetical protein